MSSGSGFRFLAGSRFEFKVRKGLRKPSTKISNDLTYIFLKIYFFKSIFLNNMETNLHNFYLVCIQIRKIKSHLDPDPNGTQCKTRIRFKKYLECGSTSPELNRGLFYINMIFVRLLNCIHTTTYIHSTCYGLHQYNIKGTVPQ